MLLCRQSYIRTFNTSIRNKIINFQDIIFYDFETGSKNRNKTQPIQLAAVAINARTLTFQPHGEFNSYIKPVFDEAECESLGLDPLQDEALKVNGIKKEDLEDAPTLKVVWGKFCDFVNTYNYKKSSWGAPIAAGYNNNGFDDTIIDRICAEHGPWDKEWGKQKLFHPIHNIDVMKMNWGWSENDAEVTSLSMDAVRTRMGMSHENSHDAAQDVKQGGALLICYLKMQRAFATKVKFKNVFAGKGV